MFCIVIIGFSDYHIPAPFLSDFVRFLKENVSPCMMALDIKGRGGPFADSEGGAANTDGTSMEIV